MLSIQFMSPEGSRGKKVSSASSGSCSRGPPFSNAANPVLPLTRLEFSMRDVYHRAHWAISGHAARVRHTRRGCLPARPQHRAAVEGRRYAATRKISRIVVAPLAGNPFPDATPQFFAALNAAFSLGLAAPIEIAAPFAHLHKEDVVKIGAQLGVPFELTLSCMNPSGTTHCGLCSKCRERRDAFQAAGIADPTMYANISPR